jgi:uncharacterized protein (DUF362 family)
MGTPVVARRNGTMNEMVNQCVEALGGIKKYVPAGSKVAIKVVGSHNNTHTITNPEMVKQVVRLVRTADPEEITVYEHPPAGGGATWPIMAQAVKSGGAESRLLRQDLNDYVKVSIPGVSLKSNYVPMVLDEADVLINLPNLRGWGNDVTIGLKNHVGSILFRGHTGSSEGELPVPDILATPHACPAGIHQGVADINTIPAIKNKHRLTIIDAIHPGRFSGLSTYNDYNGIIAGPDPVATDYAATQVLRRYIDTSQNPQTIQKAAALGLGTNDPNQIIFDERSVTEPIPELQLPMVLAGIAGFGLMTLARRSENRDNHMGTKPQG